VFDEPVADSRAMAELWPALIAALQPAGGTAAIVRRGAGVRQLAATRISARVASRVADALEQPRLGGAALEHARQTAAAALRTMDRLADDGWRSIIGDGPSDVAGLGADAVAERSDPFDPLASELNGLARAR